MVTPGGFRMSVAMTNCGSVGWVSDRKGYRYDPTDPVSGEPWPPDTRFISAACHWCSNGRRIRRLHARRVPDKPLETGAKMSLHQDKDEKDFTQPIVSVSLGLPCFSIWWFETERIVARR